MDNREKFAKLYCKNKVSSNVVLYEAYMGRGMICNPYAIFLEFMRRDDFYEYEHVWSLEDMEDGEYEWLSSQYKEYKNVHFVETNSDEYINVLTRAKYLINNVVFPDYFTRKEEQVYVNTWHGIPLKTLGYDLPGGSIEVRNTLRNFLSANYLISANEFMTKCYKEAFRLEGLCEEKIIEVGQPRDDIFFHIDKSKLMDKLKEHGVTIDPKKQLILYAPTWKGDSYGCPDISLEGYFEFIEELESKIDCSKYQLLVKPHQVVYKYIKNQNQVTSQFVPATIEANELLSITDVLVSDYSSIFYDFLFTGKPILFYIPDLEAYEDYRGLYHGVDCLPGPATKDIEMIGEWICGLEEVQKMHQLSYDTHVSNVCGKSTGNISKKVLDLILTKKKKKELVVKNRKKRILFYAGDLSQNGITHSLYSLLHIMDYSKYDVSVLITFNDNHREAIKKIDQRARVIVQTGQCNLTEKEKLQFEDIMEHGCKGILKKRKIPKGVAYREYRRLFGDTIFDTVIEFNGYSPWYGLLFMCAPKAKKLIWQHNDLKRELERTIDGEDIVRKKLMFVFELYPYYDKIVGCSPSVMKVNKENLGTRKTKHKFTYARNTINDSRIKEALANDSVVSYQGMQYYVKEFTGQEIELVALPKEGEVTFATMGRLSPEKNFKNLLYAFAKLSKEENNLKLYVIGDGILRNELMQVIKKLDICEQVILTGNLSNPFGLLQMTDCFVLPSKYEGQPLVIQEARMLGLPIVMTDFSTGKDVYQKQGQFVVTQDVEGLYEGLKAYLNHKVSSYAFDVEAYNKEVYKEFEGLFEE